MVRAYYLEQADKSVSLEELESTIGVMYTYIDHHDYEGRIQEICKERGYGHRSMVYLFKEKMPNIDEMLPKFFEEHVHEFEEIRYIVDGSGIFDVRDKQDEWIRIHVEAGDLLVLPAGIYHRFTLDEKKYAIAMRLFLETMAEPVWTPFNRNLGTIEEMPCRKTYVDKFNLSVKAI
ncbi:hypothetical protein C9374_011530 [Naegleria lovaniensis]|uniref:Acireductone dioxygenase n=1 Tax=Naegleria lovaniensis TaxID=51637 RepID=A0AA88H0V0_NAELO|nr:uncharacterized protein C9374_011530 [Naegleria lovaniensis]KAG2392805.1 hypothetical protein C9374_011530 [Naegleria lovaniensis]